MPAGGRPGPRQLGADTQCGRVCLDPLQLAPGGRGLWQGLVPVFMLCCWAWLYGGDLVMPPQPMVFFGIESVLCALDCLPEVMGRHLRRWPPLCWHRCPCTRCYLQWHHAGLEISFPAHNQWVVCRSIRCQRGACGRGALEVGLAGRVRCVVRGAVPAVDPRATCFRGTTVWSDRAPGGGYAPAIYLGAVQLLWYVPLGYWDAGGICPGPDEIQPLFSLRLLRRDLCPRQPGVRPFGFDGHARTGGRRGPRRGIQHVFN
mmetsp:Transcript_4898/g.15260  ORF Transcript_4898/g.15260 Transcript_4898/m.15260 type:complete len:259 (-) Transcript_4898:1377-2153(-)